MHVGIDLTRLVLFKYVSRFNILYSRQLVPERSREQFLLFKLDRQLPNINISSIIFACLMVTFDCALDKVTGFIVNLKEQYFRNSYANLSEMRQ